MFYPFLEQSPPPKKQTNKPKKKKEASYQYRKCNRGTTHGIVSGFFDPLGSIFRYRIRKKDLLA